MWLSSFTDDGIIYAENPMEHTEKLWELISEFSKVSEYKNNILMAIAFLYTSNEQ